MQAAVGAEEVRESSVMHFMFGLYSSIKCSFVVELGDEQCLHSAVNSPLNS